MKLKNKVVLITGANSGIGRTSALKCAAEGAKVVIAARRNDEGLQVVKEINDQGGEAIFVGTDVANEDSVKNLIAKTVETFGRLDCAINNAGAAEPISNLTEIAESEWNRVIDINLKGTWLCMKHQIPVMLKNGIGSIVNMASVYGLVGTGMGIAAYTASKHGIVGLTRSGSLEFAKRGIRINAVCPGWIPTPGNEVGLSNPDVLNFAESLHPLGRLGTQLEVANAVVWLCSDDSSFVTGQAIAVDGGFSAQ